MHYKYNICSGSPTTKIYKFGKPSICFYKILEANNKILKECV
jgi:hypothetical protein